MFPAGDSAQLLFDVRDGGIPAAHGECARLPGRDIEDGLLLHVDIYSKAGAAIPVVARAAPDPLSRPKGGGPIAVRLVSALHGDGPFAVLVKREALPGEGLSSQPQRTFAACADIGAGAVIDAAITAASAGFRRAPAIIRSIGSDSPRSHH